jgi:hypothetical protein
MYIRERTAGGAAKGPFPEQRHTLNRNEGLCSARQMDNGREGGTAMRDVHKAQEWRGSLMTAGGMTMVTDTGLCMI